MTLRLNVLDDNDSAYALKFLSALIGREVGDYYLKSYRMEQKSIILDIQGTNIVPILFRATTKSENQ